jgi:hypothetical protein
MEYGNGREGQQSRKSREDQVIARMRHSIIARAPTRAFGVCATTCNAFDGLRVAQLCIYGGHGH